MYRMACRSRRNWHAVKSVWRSLPRRAPSLTHAPKNALSGRWPSTAPSWRRGTRRRRRAARSRAAAPPTPPLDGPQPKDQINLTDEDSRIMPVAGGGFEQCYNAQAVVATGSRLVIATDVVQAPNDKQQIAPMLEKVDALPEQLGRPETLLADNGYFSEANVMACAAANIEPLIATGRQPHHPSWRERFAAPPPAPEKPTPVEAMAWRLRTPQGKQLYGLRKQTPEPVFGIIESVMGFRQFLLRGLDCVRGEWSLVTMAWNIKRMHALSLG